MKRWLLAALLLLNLVLAAWNFGVFARWGWGPDDGREPELLHQQVQPDAIRIRPLEPASAPASDSLPAASAAATAASEASGAASSP